MEWPSNIYSIGPFGVSCLLRMELFKVMHWFSRSWKFHLQPLTTSSLPPQKKARDPLIPNMSADWTPRFVHPLSAARCRWPSKLAKIWIPPSWIECTTPSALPTHPLDCWVFRREVDRGFVAVTVVWCFFHLQPPKWMFFRKTRMNVKLFHVDHGWTRTRKVIRFLYKLFVTQNVWFCFFLPN